MDREKEGERKNRFAWVADALPKLPPRIRELRQRHGDAHINECWKRGVVMGEPGWFFARQGVAAIGAPFTGDPAIEHFAAQHVGNDQCLVLIRTKGAADGAA
jgi:hypothetical protein